MMRDSSRERMTCWMGNLNEVDSCFGDSEAQVKIVTGFVLRVPAIGTIKKDQRIQKGCQG